MSYVCTPYSVLVYIIVNVVTFLLFFYIWYHSVVYEVYEVYDKKRKYFYPGRREKSFIIFFFMKILPLIAKASQSVRVFSKRASSGESGRYVNEFMVNICEKKKLEKAKRFCYDKNPSICIQLKNLSITWFVLVFR